MKDEALDKKIEKLENNLSKLRKERIEYGVKQFQYLVGEYFKIGDSYNKVTSVDYVYSDSDVCLNSISVTIRPEENYYSIDNNDSCELIFSEIEQKEIKASEFIEAMVDCYEQIKKQVL